MTSGVSLVGFGAPWCGPWLLLQPVLDRLAADGIDVRRVDTDVHGDHAERFRVIALPTFAVLRDGSEVRRLTGAVSEDELRALTAKAGKSAKAAPAGGRSRSRRSR